MGQNATEVAKTGGSVADFWRGAAITISFRSIITRNFGSYLQIDTTAPVHSLAEAIIIDLFIFTKLGDTYRAIIHRSIQLLCKVASLRTTDKQRYPSKETNTSNASCLFIIDACVSSLLFFR